MHALIISQEIILTEFGHEHDLFKVINKGCSYPNHPSQRLIY